MTKLAIYPGCSLEGTSHAFLDSVREILPVLDVEYSILDDWNCCGATSAHAIDHRLYLELALRNLALAEEQGFDEIIAPCAACYHRLASANFEFSQHPDLLEKIKTDSGIQYRGNVKVRNVLDLLANVTGTLKISEKGTKPLKDMKVACYYGCLNTRIPRMKPFDNVANPMAMDRIINAIGAKALDWSYKTDCCGASLFVTSEQTTRRLAARILEDAIVRGADCIAVACPMCHNNLDTKQSEIRNEFNLERPMPVLFISQLMGLAFGIGAGKLRLDDSFVPVNSLEALIR